MDHTPLKNDQMHGCLVYDNQEQFLERTIAYVRDGIESGDKVVFMLGDIDSKEWIRAYDHVAHGLDEALNSGQLLLPTLEQMEKILGKVTPGVVIDRWRQMIIEALKEGYEGFRGGGDASWLKNYFNADDGIMYELGVSELFDEFPIMGLCCYKRDQFPKMYLDLLCSKHVHPWQPVLPQWIS
ncbi:MAG: MEDS domain-containing protein [Candidatus Omnitrophica bacterium]|nr:MEDS domain-containing protein [Candidatus Omnitrophota bacterium]